MRFGPSRSRSYISPMPRPPKRIPRLLVRLPEGRRRAIDLDDIYILEGLEGTRTRIRLARKETLIDIGRSLTELMALLPTDSTILRIHRDHAVNLMRVRELRRRKATKRGWELKMEPPVNTVLPVADDQVKRVMRAFGGVAQPGAGPLELLDGLDGTPARTSTITQTGAEAADAGARTAHPPRTASAASTKPAVAAPRAGR